MLNLQRSISLRSNQGRLQKKGGTSPQPGLHLQFGMSAKNQTAKEKETAQRLKNNGYRVIADQVKDLWKIICDCGHQIVGRQSGDLHEISARVEDDHHH